MCDQGYDVNFKAKKCQTKSIGTREIIVEVERKNNNVYALKEKIERCSLSKIDESWLRHKRLGQLNFDQIVKLSKNNVFKDLRKMSKLDNTHLKILLIG